MSTDGRFDVCIVGAGLIGLGVGRALVEDFSGISILILEKEDRIAAHQSSHNSGVIHSGLYYKPGSLKARLAVEGRDSVYQMCEEAGIPFERSGKIVIATQASEIPALDELERRGHANGLTGLRRLGPEGIRDFEPEATGLVALHVPETGVADFSGVANHVAHELMKADTRILTEHGVTSIDHHLDEVSVTTADRHFRTRVLVNCAGLHSDKVAQLAGIKPLIRIVPFRGEYYRLKESAADLVQHLIYPVPDPRFPFLGVHFTRRIDETVEVGPNAVLALGREHYRGKSPDWSDLRETLGDSGFRRLARKHLWSGAKEMINSRSTRLYARLARRLVPAVRSEDFVEGGSGVRAQAVSLDGSLVDDFVIEQVGSTVHVLNAPSPGATASLAIGRHVAKKVHPLIHG
ncbi:MAG: L-2-hydroxyglutarate oxidase [Acidimicrobiia bacterium]